MGGMEYIREPTDDDDAAADASVTYCPSPCVQVHLASGCHCMMVVLAAKEGPGSSGGATTALVWVTWVLR